ncbi:hypothetical protein NC651_031109 [Populus alba x Populus x berolinensis]|nr:hypothetical protein NC651_031109 [Populus alba x Populus x berolinensis]
MLEVILRRGEQLPKEPTFLQWWCTYGKQCPELKRFAIRILSQACDGASRYNLKKGMAEKLLVDGRNRIEQQRLNDLAFVHYNLQLQNKRYGVRNNVVGEEIDAMDDWVVEEAPQETAPENGDCTRKWWPWMIGSWKKHHRRLHQKMVAMDDWVVEEAPQETAPENGGPGWMDSDCSGATKNVEVRCGIQAKE